MAQRSKRIKFREIDTPLTIATRVTRQSAKRSSFSRDVDVNSGGCARETSVPSKSPSIQFSPELRPDSEEPSVAGLQDDERGYDRPQSTHGLPRNTQPLWQLKNASVPPQPSPPFTRVCSTCRRQFLTESDFTEHIEMTGHTRVSDRRKRNIFESGLSPQDVERSASEHAAEPSIPRDGQNHFQFARYYRQDRSLAGGPQAHVPTAQNSDAPGAAEEHTQRIHVGHDQPSDFEAPDTTDRIRSRAIIKELEYRLKLNELECDTWIRKYFVLEAAVNEAIEQGRPASDLFDRIHGA